MMAEPAPAALGMASSAPAPLVARGTTHTISATTAAITTIAAMASSAFAFSRLRGCIVPTPWTAPPTCIAVPPSRRLSMKASGHGDSTATLRCFDLVTVKLLSLGGLYQMRHTLPSGKAYPSNAVFFTNANRLVLRVLGRARAASSRSTLPAAGREPHDLEELGTMLEGAEGAHELAEAEL